jgi:hypothetical protein
MSVLRKLEVVLVRKEGKRVLGETRRVFILSHGLLEKHGNCG